MTNETTPIDEQQVSEPIIADTETTADTTIDMNVGPAESEPTFSSVWNDLTEGMTDEIVRLYREDGLPFVKVWSKQKGNVHFRMDIHSQRECKERNCRGWQPPKQRKTKVGEPPPIQVQQEQESVRTHEVGEAEAEPVPQETTGQSE